MSLNLQVLSICAGLLWRDVSQYKAEPIAQVHRTAHKTPLPGCKGIFSRTSTTILAKLIQSNKPRPEICFQNSAQHPFFNFLPVTPMGITKICVELQRMETPGKKPIQCPPIAGGQTTWL
ncbi:hypothetical protein RRG08_014072 [Elysia crispata]|uniref:Uncharacterized protein n=1 Tax=Elysia crispata TaxID=231223 RepID=A0AAE0ZZJ1_9GAST|nr:hypothetical protein RRG08_014072 [Elysia crispata]